MFWNWVCKDSCSEPLNYLPPNPPLSLLLKTVYLACVIAGGHVIVCTYKGIVFFTHAPACTQYCICVARDDLFVLNLFWGSIILIDPGMEFETKNSSSIVSHESEVVLFPIFTMLGDLSVSQVGSKYRLLLSDKFLLCR